MTKRLAGEHLHPTQFSHAAMIILEALAERGAFDENSARQIDSYQECEPLVAAGLMGFRKVRPHGGVPRRVYWITERGQAAWIAAKRSLTQSCRHCGCTDANACMIEGQPCQWTESGLCSAPDCQKKEQELLAKTERTD